MQLFLNCPPSYYGRGFTPNQPCFLWLYNISSLLKPYELFTTHSLTRNRRMCQSAIHVCLDSTEAVSLGLRRIFISDLIMSSVLCLSFLIWFDIRKLSAGASVHPKRMPRFTHRVMTFNLSSLICFYSFMHFFPL